MVKVKICASTGTLTCTGCPRTTEELFVPGTEPTKACNPAWFIKKPETTDEIPPEADKRDKILEGVGI